MSSNINCSTLSTKRAIILGAGRGSHKLDRSFPLPRCLLTDPFGERVLDWILSAFHSNDIRFITFVGGYKIDEIGDKYPRLNYIYNPDWERTQSLSSLKHASKEIQGPTLISYSDIMFRPESCKRLLDQSGESITIAVDSSWKKRNLNDLTDAKPRKNLVICSGDFVRDIGFLEPSLAIDSEFTGLVNFGEVGSKHLLNFLEREYDQLINCSFGQSEDVRMGYITDLLRYFLLQGIEIKAVDIGPNWAEMDSPEQMSRFVLGTKGETLERLPSIVKRGHFCKQKVYTVKEWKQDSELVIQSIQEKFPSVNIVIRSSNQLEDSWNGSKAGVFESILNVDSTKLHEISKAIETVITSYSKENTIIDDSSQFLIQEMVRNVSLSGVVFTRDINTNAPYYAINYDDKTRRTDSVTSGSTNDLNTVFIYRDYQGPIALPHIESLLEVVRELEEATGCTSLDIEFAVTQSGKVFVLQTRPMMAIEKDDSFKNISITSELNAITRFLKQRMLRTPYAFGETTIFGDMPDWNPAELIGVKPRSLSLSIYQYLITNAAWRIARSRIGYHHPEPASLMVTIAGHPLIDVRLSMNNLLPDTLSDLLKEKLINHYIERLKQNREMHDKIEFEICFTCLDFDFEFQSQRLLDNRFSLEEVAELKQSLLVLTDRIVNGKVEPIEKLMGEIVFLEKRRLAVMEEPYDCEGIPLLISQLLDDCVQYGTIPFSILARYGFIAYSLLRSLVSRAVLSPEEEEAFLQTIDSVATDMANDMNYVLEGTMLIEDFLKV